jgi:hypothetical protein
MTHSDEGLFFHQNCYLSNGNPCVLAVAVPVPAFVLGNQSLKPGSIDNIVEVNCEYIYAIAEHGGCERSSSGDDDDHLTTMLKNIN